MAILPKTPPHVKSNRDVKFKFDIMAVKFLSIVRVQPPKYDPEATIHHTTFTLSGAFHWAQTRWKSVDPRNIPKLCLENFVENHLDPSFDHWSKDDRAKIARELHRQTALWLQAHPSQAHEVLG